MQLNSDKVVRAVHMRLQPLPSKAGERARIKQVRKSRYTSSWPGSTSNTRVLQIPRDGVRKNPRTVHAIHHTSRRGPGTPVSEAHSGRLKLFGGVASAVQHMTAVVVLRQTLTQLQPRSSTPRQHPPHSAPDKIGSPLVNLLSSESTRDFQPQSAA